MKNIIIGVIVVVIFVLGAKGISKLVRDNTSRLTTEERQSIKESIRLRKLQQAE